MLKRSSYKIFSSVVWALFLREVQVKFGSQKLGYLWAVLDPMIMIVVFAVIHGYTMQGKALGYDFAVFMATGFLPYNLFKGIMMTSMNAYNANKGLFVYKQVKPFDTLISRMMVESLQIVIVSFIFIFIGLYFEFDLAVKDINMVLFGIVWFILFGFSLGLLFSVITTFYESFQKIISYLSMPMLFLSGLFYTAESLPQQIRDILLYNPILHFVELIHGSYLYALDTKYVDYVYMLLWTVIPLFLGLFFYRKSEKKIVSQ